MKNARRLFLFFSFLFLIILLPQQTKAFEAKAGSYIEVASDQILEETLFAASDNLEIKGSVNGDVFCASKVVTVTGTINGDLICAAESIKINGKVSGNVRLLSENVSIGGIIGKNVNILGNYFSLTKGSQVGGDILMAGENALINGNVSGNIEGRLNKIEISGKVGKNLDIIFLNSKEQTFITLKDQAYIGGQIDYSASKEGISVLSKNVYINGMTKFKKFEEKTSNKNPFNPFWFISTITCFLLGLFFILIFKQKKEEVLTTIEKQPVKSLLFGIIIVIGLPITVTILFFTLIGIPLSLILIFSWMILMILSKVLVGLFIGNYLLKKLKLKKNHSILALTIGIIIIKLIFIIPIIGGFAQLFTILLGQGAFVLTFRKNKEKKTEKEEKVLKIKRITKKKRAVKTKAKGK